jgi:hypothetical protein
VRATSSISSSTALSSRKRCVTTTQSTVFLSRQTGGDITSFGSFMFPSSPTSCEKLQVIIHQLSSKYLTKALTIGSVGEVKVSRLNASWVRWSYLTR